MHHLSSLSRTRGQHGSKLETPCAGRTVSTACSRASIADLIPHRHVDMLGLGLDGNFRQQMRAKPNIDFSDISMAHGRSYFADRHEFESYCAAVGKEGLAAVSGESSYPVPEELTCITAMHLQQIPCRRCSPFSKICRHAHHWCDDVHVHTPWNCTTGHCSGYGKRGNVSTGKPEHVYELLRSHSTDMLMQTSPCTRVLHALWIF